jgi:geranylgeranylglyceryl phosphate synthase family protein
MNKLCVLLDPNKENVEKVAEACMEVGSSDKIEYWVGCTQSPLSEIRHYLSAISSLRPRYLYPSKLSHFFAFKGCDTLAVPVLLNARNMAVVLESKIGLLMCRFLKRSERMAYLVTNPHSSVGRRTRARELDDSQIVGRVREFFTRSPEVDSVYIEAGSGSNTPVSSATVREVRDLLNSAGSYVLTVGGGISRREQVMRLFDSGADKVVVGTALETGEVPEIVRRIRSLSSF